MPLLGPVFAVELVTTARRARYYALRSGYAAILLALVGLSYWQIRQETAAPSPSRMVAFAGSLFTVLNGVQAVAVLFLTPALVAGTIADERQRKTLHYLLASELTGREIVGGKLAARLLHALVILAAGLPVLGLLTLFGGIDPRQVALSFAGAASTAFFVACLSIFASAVSKRVRDAVGLAYLLELGWLIGPWVATSLVSGWREAEAIVGPVDAWLLASQPTALVPVGSWFDDAAIARLGWMIGLQVAFGLGFAALAVWRLRPGDRAVAAGGGSEGRRLFARPVGDDPMLWKECRVARSSGPLRIVWVGVGLMALTSLGFQLVSTAIPAFEELAGQGYGGGTGLDQRRRGDLGSLISLATTVVSFAWVVAVASTAACGLTTEREEDTWISLVGTPLEGREILRAKRIGAILRPRAIGLTLVTLWAAGVAAGSIHPLALLALAVEMAAVGGFAAALGTDVSLRSRTTGRALTSTLGLIFALAVGAPICGFLVVENQDLRNFCNGLSPPVLLSYTCADYSRARETMGWGITGPPTWGSNFVREAAFGFVITALYASAAWLLARRADLRFDRAVDRPRRPARTSLS